MVAAHVSPFSGSWYPAALPELRELVASLFRRSAERIGRGVLSNALALVVPHAGLKYSGTVAAAAYRHAQDLGAERVVILGFSHTGGGPGIRIPRIDAYVTPLGEVALDRDALAGLVACGVASWAEEASICDHSVEIQLPLLQTALPGARVVPLYVGTMSEAARREAALALGGLAGPGTVFLASSDFTHYGRGFHYQPFPLDPRTGDRLRELDFSMISAASSLDPDLFFGALRDTGSTVCGYAPVGLLLETMRRLEGEEIFQETLDYQTSGEITGDFAHSVSYAALGYFRAGAFRLDPPDQELLLESAQETLVNLRLTGERRPVSPRRESDALERRAGVFVTLYQHGELRGCVGRHGDGPPLAASVPDLALSAALDDPRFRPQRPDDAPFQIEISLLSPLKRVRGPEDLRIHEHGGHLDCWGLRGLLLPQVARERGWDRDRFLDALARKTGVGADVYTSRAARLSVFRAQTFGDRT